MASKAGSSDQAPAPPDHNQPSPLTEQQRADLLLVHLRNHRDVDKKLEAAMEVVRGINKVRKRLRSDIKADGFTLKYVDEALHDEKKAPHEIADDAANRTFIRRTARLAITGVANEDQLDLFSAKTTKGDVSLDGDDATWCGRAVAVALRGGDPDASLNGVPPERLQAWEQGLMIGYEQFDIAKKTAAEIESRRQSA